MPGQHTAKQRQVKHIASGYRKRGVSAEDAESIGWATVNKNKKKLRKDVSTVAARVGKSFAVVSLNDYHDEMTKGGDKAFRSVKLLSPSRAAHYYQNDFGSDEDDTADDESETPKPRAQGTPRPSQQAGTVVGKKPQMAQGMQKGGTVVTPGPRGRNTAAKCGPMDRNRKNRDADILSKRQPTVGAKMPPMEKSMAVSKSAVMTNPTTTEDTMITYEDLFKSELGIDDDKVLIDCPHCGHPITKSEVIAKAKGGSSASTVHDNKDGGHHRGPASGKNTATPVRTGGAVKRTDEANPHAHKSEADEENDVEKKVSPKETKKSYYGSDYVQYVDTGEDEAIAKAISEGSLGQGAIVRQPIDKNHRRV